MKMKGGLLFVNNNGTPQSQPAIPTNGTILSGFGGGGATAVNSSTYKSPQILPIEELKKIINVKQIDSFYNSAISASVADTVN